MPDRTESSKAGSSGGFKGKVKKFGQTLGVKETRSRSHSLSAPDSSAPSVDHIQSSSLARADPASTATVDSLDDVVQNRLRQDSSTRDLWQAAFETLTQEEKDALETSTEGADHAKPPPSLVEDIVRLTKEKCAQYEAGGWHIERKGHGDVNVRDKAKSLLCSVLTFKDLIDAGLKFDASGYGALAWSLVSFGLKLVQNDKDRMDAIFEASDFLAQILARYANIEAYYCNIQIPDTEYFENAIVGVYVAVLQYSAKVKVSERAGRTRRVFESIASLTGQPLQRLRKVIDSRDNATEQWRTLVEHQYRLKESHEISQKADDLLIEVTRTVTELKVLQRSVLTAEEDGMLDWLSSLKYFGKHNRLRKEVQRTNPQSGQWFLESEKFSTWDFFPQSFLWLYGPSGCGKSSLCSTIVEILEQEKRRILAYWYFDIDNSETQDVQNMLCSLLRQLSAGIERFPDAIRRLSDDHRKRGSRPSTEQLLLALYHIISSLGKDVSLVLDGLDEYPEDSGYVQWPELLKVIQDIVEQGFDNLHFLVTSRDREDIRDGLRHLSNPPREMDVEKLLLFDLEMFFDNVMQSSSALRRLGDSTKDEIRERLMASEQRRFRWAALNLDELQLCRGNDRQARQALHRIPDNVEANYLQVLENIDRHDLESAESIFEWLCVSKRPLTSIELAEAAGLSDPSDVRRICTSNLVTSSAETVNFGGRQEEGEMVRFAHSSVKEYILSESLRSAPGRASRFYVSVTKAHAHVALCCLKYLNRQREALQPRQTLLEIPLLQYSAEYWHVHARSIGSSLDESVERDIEDGAYELFRPSFSQSFSNWLRLADPEESNKTLDPDRNPDTYPEPLYYALLLGLEKVSQKLIHDNVDVNGRCGTEGTALQLAAHRGYTTVVKLLLKKGSFVNVEGSSNGSALYASTIQGHGDVVEALLEANANVNRQEGEYGNVLQVASYFPYARIFYLLLNRATDLNMAGGRYGSPLGAACAAGHYKYVMHLLDKGANPNGPGGILASPLQAALCGGHGSIVDLLLEVGARFKRNGSILWMKAESRLRNENELLMTQFEETLTSNSKIPRELTFHQQLLAAVVTRSPQEVASEHRSRVISKLAKPHGRKAYWLSLEKFIALVTDLETDSNDPEQADFLHNRLFWAGLFLAMPSVSSPGAEETIVLLEQTVRVAAHVRAYENVAFEIANDHIEGNKFYDEVDFEEIEVAKRDRFNEKVTQLCSNIFLMLAKSCGQNSANRVDLVLQALNRKEIVRIFDNIKSLNEICKEEIDTIRHAELTRAKCKILALEKKIEQTEAYVADHLARTESKMQEQVKVEVEKQLKDNLLFLMPELREKIEKLDRPELSQTSRPSHSASPTPPDARSVDDDAPSV